MRLRQIRTERLLKAGAVYRVFVVCCNALFFWLGVKACLDRFGPFGASLIWNGINMCLYYLYHYWFLRLFKIGRK